MRRLSTTLFVLILLLAVSWVSTDTHHLDVLRQSYKKALHNEPSIPVLTENAFKRKSAIYLAYQGTARALEARSSSWIPTKISKAKEAYALLNNSVRKDPINYEIRFLRYSFECETPSMLELNKHIQTDKKFLLKNAKKGQPISSVMKSYFRKNGQLSTREKDILISRL